MRHRAYADGGGAVSLLSFSFRPNPSIGAEKLSFLVAFFQFPAALLPPLVLGGMGVSPMPPPPVTPKLSADEYAFDACDVCDGVAVEYCDSD